MYYVYILKSRKNGKLYIGSSGDPDTRFASHNAGQVRSTKAFRPWKRIYLEKHMDKSAALKKEKYLKSGWGRKSLSSLLSGEVAESG